MGKGLVLEALGSGLYNIDLDRGAAQIAAEISDIETALTELEPKITEAQDDFDEKETDKNTKDAALDSAIDTFMDLQRMDNPPADELAEARTALENATKELVAARRALQKAEEKLNGLVLQQTSLTLRKTELEGLEQFRTMEVWCTDYTTTAEGEVATMEIIGEPAQVLLVPGAETPQDADGFLLATHVQKAPQLFYNLALYPGWQKWRPTFRVGAITAINGDLCDVLLDVVASREQNLSINQADELTDVPIDYMGSGGAVFLVDDRVVVKFTDQDWTQPVVIGFESNPRPPAFFVCIPTVTGIANFGWGSPYVNGEGVPINGGLGTLSNSSYSNSPYVLVPVGTAPGTLYRETAHTGSPWLNNAQAYGTQGMFNTEFDSVSFSYVNADGKSYFFYRGELVLTVDNSEAETSKDVLIGIQVVKVGDWLFAFLRSFDGGTSTFAVLRVDVNNGPYIIFDVLNDAALVAQLDGAATSYTFERPFVSPQGTKLVWIGPDGIVRATIDETFDVTIAETPQENFDSYTRTATTVKTQTGSTISSPPFSGVTQPLIGTQDSDVTVNVTPVDYTYQAAVEWSGETEVPVNVKIEYQYSESETDDYSGTYDDSALPDYVLTLSRATINSVNELQRLTVMTGTLAGLVLYEYIANISDNYSGSATITGTDNDSSGSIDVESEVVTSETSTRTAETVISETTRLVVMTCDGLYKEVATQIRATSISYSGDKDSGTEDRVYSESLGHEITIQGNAVLNEAVAEVYTNEPSIADSGAPFPGKISPFTPTNTTTNTDFNFSLDSFEPGYLNDHWNNRGAKLNGVLLYKDNYDVNPLGYWSGTGNSPTDNSPSVEVGYLYLTGYPDARAYFGLDAYDLEDIELDFLSAI